MKVLLEWYLDESHGKHIDRHRQRQNVTSHHFRLFTCQSTSSSLNNHPCFFPEEIWQLVVKHQCLPKQVCARLLDGGIKGQIESGNYSFGVDGYNNQFVVKTT